MIPPAYGLADVKNETYTAEGPISYWNAYVAVTQMHGHGSFSDPRLGIDIRNSPDMVTPKLAALRSYQHSLETPKPPPGSAVRSTVMSAVRAGYTASNNHVWYGPNSAQYTTDAIAPRRMKRTK